MSRASRAPSSDFQIKLAEAIAGQLALAVANSRLFEEARERLRETEVLLSVSANSLCE